MTGDIVPLWVLGVNIVDILAIVAFDLFLIVMLAAWAAQGGTRRVLVGLLLSAVFGVLVGIPVFAVATLWFRRRRQRTLATA